MKIIKDKILNYGEVYMDTKFVRCLNLGARLENCIWKNGMWEDGASKNKIWENGAWDYGWYFDKSIDTWMQDANY